MPRKNVKQPAEPKKVGRPSKYCKEMALRICEAIATTTESYSTICESNPDFPDRQNMRLWRYRHAEFRAMYDQAKREQAELFIEELLEIADDGHNDWMERHYKEHSSWVINGEAIARSRERINTRKWIACKLLPKVYGEKPTDDSALEQPPELKELAETINKLVQKYEREY